MNVDIDVGGSGLDEDEVEEEVIPVEAEEVEVIEKPKEPPAEPAKAPPSAAKKPSKWMKRILVLVVVVVLIVVALTAFIYLGTKVSAVDVSLDDDDPDVLNVTVLVSTTGTAGVSGKGDLKITYFEREVYSSKVTIENDNGETSIPYNSFVEGNGNYYVTVKFEGVESPPAEYAVKYIVESLNITVELKATDNGLLNLTVFLFDKNGNYLEEYSDDTEITVDEIKPLGDGSPIIEEDGPETVTGSYYTTEYPYNQAGNYTITVSLVNTRINSNSGSLYYQVTETREKIFLNMLPVADADYEVVSNEVFTFTVEFDAGSSWNDGIITNYIWDFDNDGNIDRETDSPKTTWQYSKVASYYDARLNVEGDIMIWDEIDQIYVLERGAATIRVYAP